MKNNKGITMITLVITMIVLGIIVGITVTLGTEEIKNVKIQNIQTNMLLIEAKAKEYVQNARFDLGVKPDEATDEMKEKASAELEGAGKGTKVTSSSRVVSQLANIGISSSDVTAGNVYQLSTEDLEKMGIHNVNSDDAEGWYVIVYNLTNSTVKIYNTEGIETKEGIKYCLDEIRDIL